MRIAEIFELGHRSGYDGKGRGRDGWHRKGYSHDRYHRGHSYGRKYRRRGGLLRISIGGY
ncbi:MAG: hypothetical protein ACRDTH_04075 [Pseudonocardiaceae bacterium]